MNEYLLVILGITSVIQALLLPGVIVLKYIKFSGSWFQRVVYTAGLSLMTSYFLVVLLVFIKSYKQGVLLFVFILEILLALWLFREQLEQSFYEILGAWWKKFFESIQSLVKSWSPFSNLSDLIKVGFSLGAFILSLTFLWWSIKLALHYAGTIFDVWDAVVSWNRWALSWANGAIPLGTRNYPQLIPVNYSLSYVFMNNTDIQFFAKLIVLPMAFFILGMVFDLGVQTKRKGFFFSTIVTYLLLKKFLIGELTNGYVDGTMAFFALLTVYTLIKTLLEEDGARKKQLILLGAVFAGSAGIVKQAGAYIFLLYSVWLYFGVLKKDSVFEALERKRLLGQSIVISSALALPWYVFKQILFISGGDRSEISTLVQVSSNAHYNVNLIKQIIHALSRFEIYLVLFPIILLAFFALKPLYRWLVISMIIPYPILWAIIASYDTRNLSVFIPIFGLVAGLSLEKIIDWGLSLIDFGKLKLWLVSSIILVGAILGLVAKFPASTLTEKQLTLQSQLFSAKKNALLYDLVEREGTDITILTDYPLQYIPNLGDIKLHDTYKNYLSFMSKIEANEIDYLLVPDSIYVESQIDAYINAQIDAGIYELVFEEKSWQYYKLLRVVR